MGNFHPVSNRPFHTLYSRHPGAEIWKIFDLEGTHTRRVPRAAWCCVLVYLTLFIFRIALVWRSTWLL